MNKAASISIGLALIIGIGGLVYWQNLDVPASQNTETTDTTNTNEAGGNTDATEGMTTSEVAQHGNATSCWSIINGNVYDLTSWIPKHPGGEEAILQLCGKDGSAKFNGQHGGAALQAQVLAGFKIGTLIH